MLQEGLPDGDQPRGILKKQYKATLESIKLLRAHTVQHRYVRLRAFRLWQETSIARFPRT